MMICDVCGWLLGGGLLAAFAFWLGCYSVLWHLLGLVLRCLLGGFGLSLFVLLW